MYLEGAKKCLTKDEDFDCTIVVFRRSLYIKIYRNNTNLIIPLMGIHFIKNTYYYIRCIVVIISRRPFVIETYLPHINALVVAWFLRTEADLSILY